MGNAIAQVMFENDEMVTRWISIVEIVDANGTKMLWTLAPQEMRSWDSLGLLSFAIQLEQSRSVNELREGGK